MASRYRTISRPAINLLKSTITKPSSRPVFSASLYYAKRFHAWFNIGFLAFHCEFDGIIILSQMHLRPLSQMGAVHSLLPLHTAVSSARLTSCLGADTKGCRSLSQGKILSMPTLVRIWAT
ncbi:hypothetical protein Pfo_024859 [Paulownia fortunei]|nr:hypothetical protein Pfo_024859 [Paulownia fortunei]